MSYGKFLDLIGTAQRRVLVYVPYLRDPQMGNALRAAVVDRGRRVRVVVLTVPFFAAKEDSLTNSLALSGAGVVEAQVASTTAYVLVDDHLFSSAQLGRAANVADLRVLPRTASNTFLTWFMGALGDGRTVTNYEAFLRIGGRLK
ncbi:hypothetical protein CVO96_20125 [Deinococcus koreensis]|uniref:Phospholipase D-like domain-containing protein n=1 Tax=Deinococcus koreensis TaxID=2054903 RepID=A0A2K3URQ4_9DEIO|nr:hypothetical protein CVO96_20125 [Deinococcus koreensis]